MSIWNIFTKTTSSEDQAPAVPVSIFTRIESESIKPFAANLVEGVRTHRAIKHEFRKPSGAYSVVDRGVVARRRHQRADRFRALLEASSETEQFFDTTFSENEWVETFERVGS